MPSVMGLDLVDVPFNIIISSVLFVIFDDPSSQAYIFFVHTYIYMDTKPITLPCSLACMGKQSITTLWSERLV